VGAVVLVARWRGVMAMVSLAVAAAVVGKFMLPAILTGEPALSVAVTGCGAIMFVVLYLTHGVSLRTSTALAGTLIGIAMTATFGAVAVAACRLTGIGDEGGGILTAFASDIRFQGLLTCGVVIAGLGVLNDVTVTQTSAVWELRGAAPGLSKRSVFASAMRIGRDHVASTIYTLVFAYTGTAIVTLLLLQIYDRPVLDLISTENISEELVRTLAGGTALVLSVPVTTAMAAVLAVGPPRSTPDPAEVTSPAPAGEAWTWEERNPEEGFEDFWGGSRRFGLWRRRRV
jgi:uncharacterized membrane protein